MAHQKHLKTLATATAIAAGELFLNQNSPPSRRARRDHAEKSTFSG